MDFWEKISALDNPMVEYIRIGRIKKGMLVAGVYDGEVVIGWSLCNKKDFFDKIEAFNIAEDRAKMNKERFSKYITDATFDLLDIIPFTVMNNITHFIERAVRYYKDQKLSEVMVFLLQ